MFDLFHLRWQFMLCTVGLVWMILLGGCSSLPGTDAGAWVRSSPLAELSREADRGEDEDAAGAVDESEALPQAQRTLSRIPPLAPLMRDDSAADLSAAAVRPAAGRVDAAVPPLVLPAFIDVVFGEMLELPYITGSGVAQRSDLVQLRSSGSIPSDDFLALVITALRDYGIRVVFEDGAYRIIQDQELMARRPRFIRSRASVAPDGMRPVIQFVEISALGASDMANLLNRAFGGSSNQNLRIEVDGPRNMIILNGLPEDVSAAARLAVELDELNFAGSQVMRYAPSFWGATELSQELVRLLSAEGWQASDRQGNPRPVLILPVVPANALFVFTRSAEALDRVNYWINELDRPSGRGDGPEIFLYTARNVDADILAATVGGVLAGRGRSSSRMSMRAASEGAAETGLSEDGELQRDQISADRMGNRVIFMGTANDYSRVLPLLRQLDQAPAEVLIEVTIAEITLTDSQSSGVEFLADSLNSGRWAGSVGSRGLGLGSSGLDVRIFSSDIDIAINAFHETSRVNVLSRPRLVARSGGSANIQVGADVPVISSQRAAPAQGGSGALDVLQTVDYRSTGVLLQIEPIVFGDNRVELVLTQEVSTALPTTTADISSPTISNRSLNTTLSLYDGETAVLGGLIQENYSRARRGIPGVRDVPVLGRLFSAENEGLDRTELIVFITAYILRSSEDRDGFAARLTEEFGSLRGHVLQ